MTAGVAIAAILIIDPFPTPKPTDLTHFSSTTQVTVAAVNDCKDGCSEIDTVAIKRYPQFEEAVQHAQQNQTQSSRYSMNTTIAFALSEDLVRAGASKRICIEGQCQELKFTYNGTNYMAYLEYPAAGYYPS